MSLHPLVGHEEIRATLARAHARSTLPSSLLLHGPVGVGKQRLALWLAQLVVCGEPDPEAGPCGRCGPCRMTLNLEHPDVHWYFPLERPKKVSGDRLTDALEDARMQALAELRAESLYASHSAEVRGLYLGAVRNLRSRAHRRPTMAGPVFIVGEAELLVPQEASPEAANALLKLLEEPPGGAHFILTSNQPGLLLPTIRSRTVPLHVGPLPQAEVAGFLREQLHVAAERAEWAAALGRGAIGRAMGFLPDDDGDGPLEQLRQKALALVGAAASGRRSEGYRAALGYPPAGARGLLDLFALVEEWIRDLAAVAAGAEEHVIHTDSVDRLRRLVDSAQLHAVDVPVAFSKIEWARELAKGNVNPQLVVNGLVRDLRAALLAREPAGVGR